MSDDESQWSQLTRLRNSLAHQIAEHGDQRVTISSVLGLLKKVEAIEVEAAKVLKPGTGKLQIDSEKPQVELAREPEPQGDSTSLSKYQAEIDDWLGQREHSRRWELENFRQILALGQNALRNTALINGGAAVALLAFSGNVLRDGGDATAFAAAMGVFGLGVFVTVLAMGTTYISQYMYGGIESWHQNVAKLFHAITALLAIGAMAVFVIGVNMGYEGIRDYKSPSVAQTESDTFKRNAPPPKRPPETPPEPNTQVPPSKPPPESIPSTNKPH